MGLAVRFQNIMSLTRLVLLSLSSHPPMAHQISQGTSLSYCQTDACWYSVDIPPLRRP